MVPPSPGRDGAVLERQGSERPWGVPFLDATARDDVVVRLSRGAGLPEPWPDLLGLAVRLDDEGTPVGLLLSTTGRGALTRVVPLLRRDTASVYGSIMAYSSAAGPIRLAAVPTGVRVPSDPEPLAAADAVRHPPPGLLADGPLARFRAPAYAAAQEARGGSRAAVGAAD